MKIPRLNRLFNPKSQRYFDVAVDHGFFNEPTFLAVIEDISSVIKTLAAAMPDAVQLTIGQARWLQELPARPKPALVLRTDAARRGGNRIWPQYNPAPGFNTNGPLVNVDSA